MNYTWNIRNYNVYEIKKSYNLNTNANILQFLFERFRNDILKTQEIDRVVFVWFEYAC